MRRPFFWITEAARDDATGVVRDALQPSVPRNRPERTTARRNGNAPAPLVWRCAVGTPRRCSSGHPGPCVDGQDRFNSLSVESGKYFYRARTYDPVAGRFLQRDPLGYVDGMGLYEYVQSGPCSFTDPRGTEKKKPGLSDRILKEWKENSMYGKKAK